MQRLITFAAQIHHPKRNGPIMIIKEVVLLPHYTESISGGYNKIVVRDFDL